MVAKVLKGTDIQMLPVETPAEVELSLNQDVAQALLAIGSHRLVREVIERLT